MVEGTRWQSIFPNHIPMHKEGCMSSAFQLRQYVPFIRNKSMINIELGVKFDFKWDSNPRPSLN